MLTKLMLDILKPLLRRLPRGTGTLYKLLGGNRHNGAWGRYGSRVTVGTEHGYKMILEMGDCFQRETYYLGRFYEWEAEALIKAFLRPGDTFIDVGANIGMLTLSAAAAVGKAGTVLAFEPNPQALEHLHKHVDLNGLSQVQVHDEALSCERGNCTLTVPGPRSGPGTLRPLDAPATNSFNVRTALLDDFLGEIPDNGSTLLKIDTEGYDFNVLKGARQLSGRKNVCVFAEVNDAWLKQIGQSAEEMFDYMLELGYQAYYPRATARGLRRQRRLSLEPLSLPGPHHWFNAVFARDPSWPPT